MTKNYGNLILISIHLLIGKYSHKLTVKCFCLEDSRIRWIALWVTVSDNRGLGLTVSQYLWFDFLSFKRNSYRQFSKIFLGFTWMLMLLFLSIHLEGILFVNVIVPLVTFKSQGNAPYLLFRHPIYIVVR